MQQDWLKSGRIETGVAFVVLVAVLALFLKFHWATSDQPLPPEPKAIEPPAAAEPTSPPNTLE